MILPIILGAEYPESWIRNGECLDNNEPPLSVKTTPEKVAIKPQINHNVIGNSIRNVDNATQCAEKCFDNVECR